MKLTRKRNKGLFGVCAGLGEWSNLSPYLWRLAFIVTFGGGSWLIYLILYFSMQND